MAGDLPHDAELPNKIERQIDKVGLPRIGGIPFRPEITTNRRGEGQIEKALVSHGPKKGKKGYLDCDGRIWIKDRGHG